MRIGLVVRRGERTYQLESELEDGTLVFKDRVTGRPWSTSRYELWQEIEGNKVQVITGKTVEETSTPVPSRDLVFSWSSVEEKYRTEVELRQAYVRGIAREGISRGMRRAITAAIAKIAKKLEDNSPPSASTVMSWMRKSDDAGGAPVAQLSGHATRKGVRRIPDLVLEIARNAVATYYCSRKRPTLEQTRVYAQKELALAVKQQQIQQEQATISASLLHRLKSEIDPYVIDLKRYGDAYARNRWRYSKGGRKCERVLQRYEVDHTVLDIVVICDRTGMPLGRPTLSVVMDGGSGYCSGFFLSFWGTGLAATFCALRVAIAPKEDLRGVLEGLQHEWLGYGLPEELVVDNGLEFHSPQFRDVALQLNIDIDYCAVRQPWLKPFAERALGEVLNYLPHAGRIRKRLNNELPVDPAETAAITFSDLTRGLMIAFCDIHAFEINQRTLERRYDRFKEGIELLPPPILPAGTRELEIIVSPSKDLTVGNEGVVTDHLRFNCGELQALRRGRSHTFKTKVKLNPEDLEYVWVQDPISKGWLMVPSCQPEYTSNLSIVQHRAIRSHKKAELTRKNATEVLLRGKTELLEMWNSRTIQGRRLKGAHLRALSGFTSSRALRLAGGEPQTPPAAHQLVSEEEMAAPARETPLFETFSM